MNRFVYSVLFFKHLSGDKQEPVETFSGEVTASHYEEAKNMVNGLVAVRKNELSMERGGIIGQGHFHLEYKPPTRELFLAREDGQRFTARFMENTLSIAIENQIIGQSIMLDVNEAHQLLTLLRDRYSYADPNKELAALYREVQALRKWKRDIQALLNRAPY